MEISMCDNVCRESRDTVRAGVYEIRAPVACMVYRADTRPPLAKNERSLPHLALGNHAAADARCGGGALLRKFPGAVPRRASVGTRRVGGSAEPLGGALLLQPRKKSASCGPGNRRPSRWPVPEKV